MYIGLTAFLVEGDMWTRGASGDIRVHFFCRICFCEPHSFIKQKRANLTQQRARQIQVCFTSLAIFFFFLLHYRSQNTN